MFEFLEPFNKIFITGPCRSGTTITSRMIANDLDLPWIDEICLNFSFMNLYSIFGILNYFSVQCAMHSSKIHLFGDFENVAIIMMKRNKEDVNKSRERIDMIRPGQENSELKEYNLSGTGKSIYDVKYDYWYNYQKPLIKNAFEIEYDSLKEHPMWIDKDKRSNFTLKQTTLRGDKRLCYQQKA